MDWTDGESAPVRLIEHSDGKEFGTGFAVLCNAEATWLVTCAHVVDTRPGVKILVSGRGAEIVANGRAQGREKKIDLAILRVPGLRVARVLPIARLENPHSCCSIPGWSKHGEGSYRADCLDAAIVKPFAWTEPGSRLIAHAYELAIEHEARLAKGFSGAPVISSETGEVFAVVATKEEPSTSGSAVCISHLMDICPEMSEKVLAASVACRPTSKRAVEDNHTKPTVSSQRAELANLEVIANYQTEQDAFSVLWEPHCKKRILLLRGESGHGKTRLLQICRKVAPNSLPQVFIDCKQAGISVADVLLRSADCLRWENLPAFSRQFGLHDGKLPEIRGDSYTLLTYAWLFDVSQLDTPFLMAVDTYEKAGNVLQNWLNSLLRSLPESKPLRLVVAGREIPSTATTENWVDYCNEYELLGVRDAEHWLPVIKAMGLCIPGPNPQSFLQGICYALKGKPASIMDIIKTFPLCGGGHA